MAEQKIVPENPIVENEIKKEVPFFGPDVTKIKEKPFLGMEPKGFDVEYRNFYPDGGGEENFKFLDPETGDPEGGYQVIAPTQRRVLPDGTLGDADAWGNAAPSEQKLSPDKWRRTFAVGNISLGIDYTNSERSDRRFIDAINEEIVKRRKKLNTPPPVNIDDDDPFAGGDVALKTKALMLGKGLYNYLSNRGPYKFGENEEWDPEGFYRDYIKSDSTVEYHPNAELLQELGGVASESGQFVVPKVGGKLVGPNPMHASLQEMANLDPAYLAVIAGAVVTKLNTPTIASLFKTTAVTTAAFTATGTVLQQIAQVMIDHPDRPKSFDEALARGGLEVLEQTAWEWAFRAFPLLFKSLPFNIRGRVSAEAKATQKILRELDYKEASNLTLGQLKGNQGIMNWIETFMGAGFLGGKTRRVRYLTRINLAKESRRVSESFMAGHEKLYGKSLEETLEFAKRIVNQEISIGKAWATLERQKIIHAMDGIKYKERYVQRGINMKGLNVEDIFKRDPQLFNSIVSRQKLTVNKEFLGVIKPAKPGTSETRIVDAGLGQFAPYKEVPSLGYGGPGITGAGLSKQPRHMSLEDIITFRTNLNSIIKSKKGTPESVGLGQIKRALDEAIMNHLPNRRLREHWEMTNEIYKETFALRDSVQALIKKQAANRTSFVMLDLEPEDMDKYIKLVKEGRFTTEMTKAGADLRSLDLWKSSTMGSLLDTTQAVMGKPGIDEIFLGEELVEKLIGAKWAGANRKINAVKLFGKKEFDEIEKVYRATEFSDRVLYMPKLKGEGPTGGGASLALQFMQIPVWMGAVGGLVGGEFGDTFDTVAGFIIFGPYAWGRIATSKFPRDLLMKGLNAQRAGKMGVALSIGTRLKNWDEQAVQALERYYGEVMSALSTRDQRMEELLRKNPALRRARERYGEQGKGESIPRHFGTPNQGPLPEEKDKRVTPPIGLIPGIGG